MDNLTIDDIIEFEGYLEREHKMLIFPEVIANIDRNIAWQKIKNNQLEMCSDYHSKIVEYLMELKGLREEKLYKWV